MNTLSDRIRDGRRAKGLTQSDVANRLNVSVQAVSQWESGRTAPSADKLVALSEVIGLDLSTVGMISGGNILPPRGRAGGIMVPLIDRVTAGQWTEIVNPVDYFSGEPAFEINWTPRGVAFALELTGESMLPEFTDGDVVIADTGVEPLPGDFVVAALNEAHEATFKKYRPRGLDADGAPIIELAPLNPDYPTLEISAKRPGHIVGTMMEHRRFRRRR